MTESEETYPPTFSARVPAVYDASPLILLDRLGYLPAIRDLRGSILIPEAVARELQRQPGTPASDAPDSAWVEVRSVQEHLLRRVMEGPPTIDAGEAEAIALALAEQATVVIDDLKGRERARRVGASVTGTIGELLSLRSLGFTAGYSQRSAVEDLRVLHDAGMRLTDELRQHVLRELESNER